MKADEKTMSINNEMHHSGAFKNKTSTTLGDMCIRIYIY